MKKATITETKNNLSKLLKEVRNGNSIVILDRGTPIARLDPIAQSEIDNLVSSLVRSGLGSNPQRSLDPNEFLSRRKVRLKPGTSAVQALVSEREEAR